MVASTLNPDGSFTYTPVANYQGTDSFVYKGQDTVFGVLIRPPMLPSRSPFPIHLTHRSSPVLGGGQTGDLIVPENSPVHTVIATDGDNPTPRRYDHV